MVKLSGPMVNVGCRPPWAECAETGLEDAGELEEETPARAGFAPTTLTLGGEVCGVMVIDSPPRCRTGCRVERWSSGRVCRKGGLSWVEAGVNGGEFICFLDESGVEELFSREGSCYMFLIHQPLTISVVPTQGGKHISAQNNVNAPFRRLFVFDRNKEKGKRKRIKKKENKKGKERRKNESKKKKKPTRDGGSEYG